MLIVRKGVLNRGRIGRRVPTLILISSTKDCPISERVRPYDPAAMDRPKAILHDVGYCTG